MTVKNLLAAFLLAICFSIVVSHASRRFADPRIELFTSEGAWCWIADPRAVYHEGQYKRTYVGWVNKKGDVKIGCYDHETKKIETATLKKNLQRDDHANPALLIRKDGHIMVFYSAHGGANMFYRISKTPEEITSWNAEMRLRTNTGREQGYTYPNVFQLAKEGDKIYLFWRGGNFKPSLSESQDGIHWTDAKTFILGSGRRPYVKFSSNNFDTIHFAFTDGHPSEGPVNSIYYARYRDGAFYKADGSLIKRMEELPLAPSEADQVYDAAVSGARAWIWDIAIDHFGSPVIVYAVFPEETKHLYKYARWNGKKWEDHEVVSAGGWFPQTPKGRKESEVYYSGGITLDHTNPAVVYLSRPTQDVYEIEKWTTPDGGSTWKPEKITLGSRKNNIRPVVPLNKKSDALELIWMYGDYVHWTNYNTALRMKRNVSES